MYYSSLLGTFVSYKENIVLWCCPWLITTNIRLTWKGSSLLIQGEMHWRYWIILQKAIAVVITRQLHPSLIIKGKVRESIGVGSSLALKNRLTSIWLPFQKHSSLQIITRWYSLEYAPDWYHTMALNITTFSIMTLNLATFSIMILSLTTFSITLLKHDIQRNCTKCLCWVSLCWGVF
jgi:hypothetical protein